MQNCCSQLGNGTIYTQGSCYEWCDIDAADTREFSECLKDGTNSSSVIHGLGCSLPHEGNEDDSSSASVHSAPKTAVSVLLCCLLASSILYA